MPPLDFIADFDRSPLPPDAALVFSSVPRRDSIGILAAAIARAVEARGIPNSFFVADLARVPGAPVPTVIGWIGRNFIRDLADALAPRVPGAWRLLYLPAVRTRDVNRGAAFIFDQVRP